MCAPSDFRLATQSNDFVWRRDEKNSLSQVLWLYSNGLRTVLYPIFLFQRPSSLHLACKLGETPKWRHKNDYLASFVEGAWQFFPLHSGSSMERQFSHDTIFGIPKFHLSLGSDLSVLTNRFHLTASWLELTRVHFSPSHEDLKLPV